MKYLTRRLPLKTVLVGIVLAVLVLPMDGLSQSSPIQVNVAGGKTGQIQIRAGMVDLQSLIEFFDLRSSMDVLGDRLDLVGSAGSCRLLLESPLILAKGLFAVMSGPLADFDGQMGIPPDFLTEALPALTGRSSSLDNGVLTLGKVGTGSFKGQSPDKLTRHASFILRDQYLPEEALHEKPKGLSVVVLDPGHGGRSVGARGSTGTLEKDLVLSVAEKLRTKLEEGLGVKVVLTRTADYYVGLKERTAIANNNGADLFLSIHANATYRRDIDGYETYYLNLRTTDQQARRYAEEENRALGVKGGDNDKALLEAILWDMAQTKYLKESSELASMAQARLVGELRGRDRGVRQAPLAVLMGASMPAALVEIGYISNPEQEVRLNRTSHQDQIASALYKAIEDYNRALIRGEIKRVQP